MLIEWFSKLPYLLLSPPKRLSRARNVLEKLLSQGTVSLEAEDKAWSAYLRALDFAEVCGTTDIVAIVTAFDQKFKIIPERRFADSNEYVESLLSGVKDEIPALEAAWLLSSRLINTSATQEYQQRICLELVRLHDPDRLIRKLHERGDTLTFEQLTSVLQLYLKGGSFDDHFGWRPYLLGFAEDRLPRLHQVFGHIGRNIEAAEMAEEAGDFDYALEYLWPVDGLDAATRRLTLAERIRDDRLIIRAHNTLAQVLWDLEDFAAAAEHFEKCGLGDRAGDSYRNAGRIDLAIRCRSNVDAEWLTEIRSEIQADVQKDLVAKDFIAAVRTLRKIQLEWEKKGADPVYVSESKRAGELLTQSVKMARLAFESEIKRTIAKPGDEVFKRWSDLEEAAGNYLEAGLHAEIAHDYFAASLAFEKANAFGQALAALDKSSPDPDLLKRAELLQAGGDYFTAALLYERLAQIDLAIKMYHEAGEFGRAADLLKEKLGDSKAPFDDDFLSLLTKANRVEELADLCYAQAEDSLRTAAERSRLLRRIKDLESRGLVGSKWTDIVGSGLQEVEVADRTKFNENAGKWMLAGTREVLADYDTTFGLDLGTTNSVVALYNKRLGKPEVVELRGKQMFPSNVIIDRDGREIVGDQEAEWVSKSPRAVLSRTKRAMGTNKKFKLRDRDYRPEEISARLIGHAERLAKAYLFQKVAEKVFVSATSELGEIPADEWVSSFLAENPPQIEVKGAVITVPAYFNDSQTKATRTASELAKIDVLRLIHEPTAACIAQRFTSDLDETLLVVDLGAGTLDLSVVEVGSGIYEVKEIEGDTKLGSADIDDILYEHFINSIRSEYDLDVSANKLACRRLKIASEEMKIQLSAQTEWAIALPALIGSQTVTISLTRAELEKMASAWLARLHDACMKIKERPSRIYLIGGGGLAPSVRSCVRDVFGVEPSAGMEPLTAVARGAAIQAAILSGCATDSIVLDVVPFSLGISSYVSPEHSKFDKLIHKHTRFPTTTSSRYTTVHDNQEAITIEVFQGENYVPKLNHKIGQFTLEGIPRAKAGVPSVEVTFSIDANCILTVSAHDRGTNHERSIRIADSLLLTPAQIKTLRAKFDGDQNYRDQLEILTTILSQLDEIVVKSRPEDLTGLGDRLESQIKYYEANMAKFAPTTADNDTLLVIYRERNDLRNTATVLTDKLANILAGYAVWRDLVASIDTSDYGSRDLSKMSKAVADGGLLLNRAQKQSAAVNEVESIYRRWLNVLYGLPINLDGEPDQLARHYFRLSKFDEALEYFDRIPSPTTKEDVELGLEILAKVRNRDRYEEFLDRNADLLGVQPTDLDRLNRTVRLYSDSVVWLHNNFEDGSTFATGSGFFIGKRLIATNRHVVLDRANKKPVPPSSIRVVTNRSSLGVSAIHLPSFGYDDVAILELVDDCPDAKPIRLAYSELVEVGERVITLGFPSPDPTNFAENLFCNSGVVNRIKFTEECSERVLEISIQLHGGISGAPLVNSMGEVIGLVTFSRQRQRTSESGQIDIERSFYALPVQVLRNLRDEIVA